MNDETHLRLPDPIRALWAIANDDSLDEADKRLLALAFLMVTGEPPDGASVDEVIGWTDAFRGVSLDVVRHDFERYMTLGVNGWLREQGIIL